MSLLPTAHVPLTNVISFFSPEDASCMSAVSKDTKKSMRAFLAKEYPDFQAGDAIRELEEGCLGKIKVRTNRISIRLKAKIAVACSQIKARTITVGNRLVEKTLAISKDVAIGAFVAHVTIIPTLGYGKTSSYVDSIGAQMLIPGSLIRTTALTALLGVTYKTCAFLIAKGGNTTESTMRALIFSVPFTLYLSACGSRGYAGGSSGIGLGIIPFAVTFINLSPFRLVF